MLRWYHPDLVSSDLELLDAWCSGDDAAAKQLVERHFEGLCRFFRNKIDHDIDELIQQTFLALTRSRRRLPPGSSFRAYLFTIARHELYARYRSRMRDAFDPRRSSLCDVGPSPSSYAGRRQEQRLLLEALRRIPIDLQIALELHYWEEMSGSELAVALEIPEGTVRSRLRRAKTMLREQLETIAESREVLDETVSNLDDWARTLAAALPVHVPGAKASKG